MLTGGCFCGDVRYEAGGDPFHSTACHCSICRRTTGALFVAWFSAQRASFRLLQGAPTRFRSSAKATRSFCSRCGAQLTFEYDGSADIDIATCSLDHPEQVPPQDHIYVGDKLSWIKLADGLPEHRGARP